MKNKILFSCGLLLGCHSLATYAAQQESSGFLEDSTVSVLNRTVYDYRNYRHGDTNSAARNKYKLKSQRNDYAEEWGYGLMTKFESGFTQGTLGVGMDAFGFFGLKLDSGGGRAGKSRLLAVKNDGHVRSSYERFGAAGKLRFSSTVIKYGIQQLKTPIFSTSDSRLLPESATGWLVTSQEIRPLMLQLGHFTAAADRNASSSTNDLVVNYANPAMKKGKNFDFVGGNYALTDQFNLMSYVGRYQNNWYTYYIGSGYRLPLNETQSIKFDFNLYHSKDYGKAYAGKISNNTWSFMTSYVVSCHQFSIGYQRVNSDTPFDYVSRGAIWLNNAAQLSDFNAPHERSWQLAYQLDLAIWDLNGALFNIAYIKGDHIDGTRMTKQSAYYWLGYGKNGQHWERDISLQYKVPEGFAKDLKISLRYDVHRANKAQAELNTDQIRVAVEYPLVW